MQGGFQSIVSNWLSGYEVFYNSVWRPVTNPSHAKRASIFVFFAIALLAGAFLSTPLLFSSPSPISRDSGKALPSKVSDIPKKSKNKTEFPLNCSSFPPFIAAGNQTTPPQPICPINYYPSNFQPEPNDAEEYVTCPDYFRWIHEDLRPWKHTGITMEMVADARKTATFKLVIVDGKMYVERYEKGFQSRGDYTLWGVLQMLRRYPRKLPDLELMFDCVDWPVINISDFNGSDDAPPPPPLFRYCGDDSTLDIVFPDWTFWGWPEVNIKPWGILLEELKEGNRRRKWVEREPFAYWKGNPQVAPTREDLLKCNVSQEHDWGARLYAQDWGKELNEGFRQSDLASQCIHRYKIYIEGSAWSVSEKYILACDSLTFIVSPKYYDFFSRGLMPVHHYWPINVNEKCKSIKFAVQWGNSHKQKARAIGKAASDFIQEDLKMEFVYDYMFHLLNEYAKLLKFKPSVSPDAVELCSEAMSCSAEGFDKDFKLMSMVKAPSQTPPCTMPVPFDQPSLLARKRKKENSIKRVEVWETKYWESQAG